MPHVGSDGLCALCCSSHLLCQEHPTGLETQWVGEQSAGMQSESVPLVIVDAGFDEGLSEGRPQGRKLQEETQTSRSAKHDGCKARTKCALASRQINTSVILVLKLMTDALHCAKH